jgi:hypothetical protein
MTICVRQHTNHHTKEMYESPCQHVLCVIPLPDAKWRPAPLLPALNKTRHQFDMLEPMSYPAIRTVYWPCQQ